jgi:hypothetical protein
MVEFDQEAEGLALEQSIDEEFLLGGALCEGAPPE